MSKIQLIGGPCLKRHRADSQARSGTPSGLDWIGVWRLGVATPSQADVLWIACRWFSPRFTAALASALLGARFPRSSCRASLAPLPIPARGPRSNPRAPPRCAGTPDPSFPTESSFWNRRACLRGRSCPSRGQLRFSLGQELERVTY
jgi:hypothetical protein